MGEVMDKGGEYTTNAALTAAPFTEGGSLVFIPPAELVSNLGWGLKFGVNISDGGVSTAIIEGSKKLISTGIDKLGDKLIDNSFILNPEMTKMEQAVHETVIGGTTTAVSKSVENTIDEKMKKK